MTSTRPLYVVTGADGFLGSAIVRALVKRGDTVRAGYYPSTRSGALDGLDVECFLCDVRNPAHLDRLLDAPAPLIVIHTAGIVSIANHVDSRLWSVNVGGTSQVIAACRRHKVLRLVHVSSVHALPELAPYSLVHEISHFDPGAVIGAYARTKAEASRRVTESSEVDWVMVHPSGIVGPGDHGHSHLVEFIRSAARGKLRAIVKGSHDMVDVRDVALGTIAAADRGRSGTTYLLTGHQVPITWICTRVAELADVRKPICLPVVVAHCAALFMAGWYRLKNKPPLFTNYSLHALSARQVYVNARAQRELGFNPRPFDETLTDTVDEALRHPTR